MAVKQEQTETNTAADTAADAVRLAEESFLAEMASDDSTADDHSPAAGAEGEAVSSETQKTDEGEQKPAEGEEAKSERVEVFPGYTAEELSESLGRLDKLQKAIDSTSGTLGSRMAEIQKSVESIQSKGVVGRIDPKLLDKLRDDYPELADLLASEDAAIAGTEQNNDQETDQKASKGADNVQSIIEAMQQRENERELRRLSRKHPDWLDVASYSVDENQNFLGWKDPNFGAFVESQPPQMKADILGEWDAEFIGNVISQYKESLKKTPETKQTQKPNLEGAVLPDGARGQHVTKAVDEEDEAFRKEMAAG